MNFFRVKLSVNVPVILHISCIKSNNQFSLVTKRIKNPVEYCSGEPAKGLPSDYAGHYVDHATSSKHTSIQDQGRNKNAGEGSSKLYNVVMDYEGREIDLNKSFYNDEDFDEV